MGLYLGILTSVHTGEKAVNFRAESPPLDNWVSLESFVNQIPRVQSDLFFF